MVSIRIEMHLNSSLDMQTFIKIQVWQGGIQAIQFFGGHEYGAYAVFAIIVFIVCIFFDAKKHMPKIHEELRSRAKKAAEDHGEVWIALKEQERLEMEKVAKELEQSRIEELKAMCARKGLDCMRRLRRQYPVQSTGQRVISSKCRLKKL